MSDAARSGGILFLGVHNAARSQMAEGLARRVLGDAVRVASAGSAPTQVAEEAVQVMAELGIDVRGRRAKAWDEVDPAGVGVVVTMGDEVAVPWWLDGMARVAWAVADPQRVEAGAAVALTDEERVHRFRAARDAIRVRVHGLRAERRGVTLRAMQGDDVDAVHALLARCDLPTGGVEPGSGRFVVAVGEGRIVGVAGVEAVAGDLLLRSVAVDPKLRGEGVAHALVAAVLDGAVDAGEGARPGRVWLLTTTAVSFFGRFGFRALPREGAPDGIRQSESFARLCPSSAVLMRR